MKSKIKVLEKDHYAVQNKNNIFEITINELKNQFYNFKTLLIGTTITDKEVNNILFVDGCNITLSDA
jgi:hypothetical protein